MANAKVVKELLRDLIGTAKADGNTDEIVAAIMDAVVPVTHTIYEIVHQYDVDGGFGDEIGQETVVGYCTTKEKAEEYVAKWDKTHAYDKPYMYLDCMHLIVRERKMEELDINEDPWRRDDIWEEWYYVEDTETRDRKVLEGYEDCARGNWYED